MSNDRPSERKSQRQERALPEPCGTDPYPHQVAVGHPRRETLPQVAALALTERRRRYRLERLVGPVGWWDELRAYQFNFVRRMGLEPKHRMLDIGCGPLQGGIPFMSFLEADCYVGIDARAHVLDEAYRLIAKEKLCTRTRVSSSRPGSAATSSRGASISSGSHSYCTILTSRSSASA